MFLFASVWLVVVELEILTYKVILFIFTLISSQKKQAIIWQLSLDAILFYIKISFVHSASPECHSAVWMLTQNH